MDFARAENTSRRYLDLILEANKRTNLTRITSREEAEVLHLEDSWVGLRSTELLTAVMVT